jgi:hypothetical protein
MGLELELLAFPRALGEFVRFLPFALARLADSIESIGLARISVKEVCGLRQLTLATNFRCRAVGCKFFAAFGSAISR